jgi:hypothetical protein
MVSIVLRPFIFLRRFEAHADWGSTVTGISPEIRIHIRVFCYLVESEAWGPSEDDMTCVAVP